MHINAELFGKLVFIVVYAHDFLLFKKIRSHFILGGG